MISDQSLVRWRMSYVLCTLSVFKLLSLLIFCVTFDCLFLNINFNIQTYKSYFIFCHIFCYDLTYNWVSHSLHLQCIWTHNCPDSLIDDVMNIFSARNTYFFCLHLLLYMVWCIRPSTGGVRMCMRSCWVRAENGEPGMRREGPFGAGFGKLLEQPVCACKKKDPCTSCPAADCLRLSPVHRCACRTAIWKCGVCVAPAAYPSGHVKDRKPALWMLK